MKAYRGVVKDGVIVLERGKLPEGAIVTVTVGDGELVRATITSAFTPKKKPASATNSTVRTDGLQKYLNQTVKKKEVYDKGN